MWCAKSILASKYDIKSVRSLFSCICWDRQPQSQSLPLCDTLHSRSFTALVLYSVTVYRTGLRMNDSAPTWRRCSGSIAFGIMVVLNASDRPPWLHDVSACVYRLNRTVCDNDIIRTTSLVGVTCSKVRKL